MRRDVLALPMRRLLPALLLGALLAGCMGSDGAELVRVQNDGGPAEGSATLRFVPVDTGPASEEVPLTLRAGAVGEFLVNLTSDVRYEAVLVTPDGVLRSEPFVTGLGEWHVYVIIRADRLHVSTVHGE